MSHAVSTNPKHCKVFLLGTSALVCLALAAPVMADDFVITGSDNSTNGTGTTNGGTAAAIADTAINGSDTVSLGIALTTTGTNEGIQTSNVDNVADGNAITVTEAGSITTGTGNNAYGIYNDGDDNTTTMSGSISTTGLRGYGIYNEGSDNTTTMSGSISTTGYRGYGIYNKGSGNTTIMSGSISTTGFRGGLVNYGDDNTTTMSGSISTTGIEGFGIWNYGSGNTTTMSGSISTTGEKAYGINIGDNNTTTISSFGDNNTTTVSGSIKTEGAGAHGIYNIGDNNTTTISGTVKVTGTKSAALYNVYGSGNSFTLNEGATIIGDILASDATNNAADATNSKLIFNLGASTSYAYSVSGKGEGTGEGQWDFSDLDRSSQVVTTSGTGCDTTITGAGNTVCNLVTGVSTGNLEVQDELQFSMNSSMIGSLSLGSSNSAAPVEAMSFAQTPQNNAWANIYGDTSDRSASTTKLAFN